MDAYITMYSMGLPRQQGIMDIVMHMEVEAAMVTAMATEANMVMVVNTATVMVTAMEEAVDKASKKNRRNNITKIQ